MKIALIEDDVDEASLVAQVLVERGHEVVTLGSAETALAALAGALPDLLVIDLRLPGMDGLELCRRLRAEPGGRDTTILVITGLTNPADLTAALDAGADDYLGKPFSLAQLEVRLAVVERLAAAVSARVAAERGQRQTAERLRLVLENLPAAAYMGTSALSYTDFLYVAPQIEALMGYTAAEWMANTGLWLERMHPDDRERVVASLSDDAADWPDWVAEYRTYTRAGRMRWLRDQAVRVPMGDGVAPYFLGFMVDVTATKEAEERQRAQFQELPVPTYVWRRRGDDWILVDYNRAALRITRGVVADLIGATASTMHADRPEVLADFARCWESRATIEREMVYYFSSVDETKTLVVSYVFVPPDTVLIHTIDVTERERARVTITRYLGHFAALRAIDLAITASLDVRETLDVLLEQAMARLGADAATVLLYDDAQGTLEFSAGRGIPDQHLAAFPRLGLQTSLAGRAVLERRPVRVPDLRAAGPMGQVLAGLGFTSYIAVPLIAKGQVQGVLELLHHAPHQPDDDWLEFLEMLASQAAIAIDNARLYQDLQRSNSDLTLAYDTTIEGWSRALDLRDRETEGHSQRVTDLTLQLVRALGMNDQQLAQVRRGALLHDIGKMGIPDAILLKPGPLTDQEWLIMRRHPTYSYELLAPIAYLRPALDVPYCHHEKWDGTGYPRGLRGDRIPLAARAFAVVDVWDALSSDRPYRAAWPPDRVRAHILALMGSHLDPQVARVFLAMQGESA